MKHAPGCDPTDACVCGLDDHLRDLNDYRAEREWTAGRLDEDWSEQ